MRSGCRCTAGVSETDCIRSISQHMVSYSSSVAVDGAQSRKFAPASVWAMVRSLISASLWSAIACLMEGIAPLIFSPMMIIVSKHLSVHGCRKGSKYMDYLYIQV